jgi:hypothetical protein
VSFFFNGAIRSKGEIPWPSYLADSTEAVLGRLAIPIPAGLVTGNLDGTKAAPAKAKERKRPAPL